MLNGRDGRGSDPSRDSGLRVLCSQYDTVHFLLNRTQCSASLFASNIHQMRSRHRYMREIIITDDGGILLFDLHQFWSDTFRVTTRSGADLALISEVELFSAGTQTWLQTKFFPQLSRLEPSTSHIAFRIPSNTTMITLPLAELESHDRTLRERLRKRGMMAVHPTTESMGFFFDLELLVRSRLLFAHENNKGDAS